MSMRTRNQRQLAAQAGVAPSPPHVLTDEPKVKRRRTQKSQVAEASPSSQTQLEAQSSTQPKKSTRPRQTVPRSRARGARRGPQAQTATQQDAPEALHTSPQFNAAVQLDTSFPVHQDGSPLEEEANGETPASHLGSAAHPVSAAHGPSPNANAQAFSTGNDGGPTSDVAARPVPSDEALSGISPTTHPVSAARGSSPNADAQPNQELPGPSGTSQLFRQLLNFPVFPTAANRDAMHHEVRTVVERHQNRLRHRRRTVPGSASPPKHALGPPFIHSPTPIRPFETPGERKTRHVVYGHTSSEESSDEEPSDTTTEHPDPSNPDDASHLTFPPLPHIHYLPSERDKPYSLMHIWVDSHPATNDDADVTRQGESIAIAIPTDQLPYHMWLAKHLNPEHPDVLAEDHVARRVKQESKLTRDFDLVYKPRGIRGQKRKFPDDDHNDVQVTSIDNTRQSRTPSLREPQAQAHSQVSGEQIAPTDNVRQSRTPSPREPQARANSRIAGAQVASTDNVSQSRTPSPQQAQEKPRISGRVMKRNFLKMARERKRAALEESARAYSSYGKGTKLATKRVEDKYDENGMLTLGKWKDIIVEVDDTGKEIHPIQAHPSGLLGPPLVEDIPTENAPADQQNLHDEEQDLDSQAHDQVPETPRARGWGFSSFIPSVQSVTKFIPFASRRTPPAAVQAQEASDVRIFSAARSSDEPNIGPISSTSQKPTPFRRAGQPAERVAALKQHQLLTKAESSELQRLKKEREELRAAKERLEQEKKEWEEHKAKVATAERTQTPGTKRKRLPSPDVIPLLPSGAFGLHPDYFTYDSSDEDSEEEQETPTKRPTKRSRVNSSGSDALEDSFNASPNEGGRSVIGGQTSEANGTNIFRQDVSSTGEVPNQKAATNTPSTRPGAYLVPSPSDGDSDEESQEGVDDSETRCLTSSQSQPSSAAQSSASNPKHAYVPKSKPWTWVDPVEKARKKALMYQPKSASRLRQSSRLSSSTVGSDAGDESADIAEKTAGIPAEHDNSQYDPRRPGLLPGLLPSSMQLEHDKETQQIAPTSTAANEETLTANQSPYGASSDPSVTDQPSTTNDESDSAVDHSLDYLFEDMTDEQYAEFLEKDMLARASAEESAEQSAEEASKIAHTTDPPIEQASQIASGSTTGTEKAVPNTPSDLNWAYEAFQNTMSSKVQAYLNGQWNSVADAEFAASKFASELEAYKQQESLDENGDEAAAPSIEADNADFTPSSYELAKFSPRVRDFIDRSYAQAQEEVEEKIPSNGADDANFTPSSYERASLSPKVRAVIDSNYAQAEEEIEEELGDEEELDEEFEEGFQAWQENKIRMHSPFTPSIAA